MEYVKIILSKDGGSCITLILESTTTLTEVYKRSVIDLHEERLVETAMWTSVSSSSLQLLLYQCVPHVRLIVI